MKMAVFRADAPCSLAEVHSVSKVLAPSLLITLMTEVASTSEISPNDCQTTQNNPEHSQYTHKHKNLKSHLYNDYKVTTAC
jgi:hypothetical protein